MNEEIKSLSPEIENLRELYLNENFVRSRDCEFRRVDLPGVIRDYIEVERDGKAAIAASVTTIEKKTIPMSFQITDWMFKNQVNYKWLMEQSANYGTFFHTLCAHLVRGGEIDLDPDALYDRMKTFYNLYREGGFDFEPGFKWYQLQGRNLKTELISFLRFAEDYDITPAAIEYKLMSKKEIGAWCLKNKKFAECAECKSFSAPCENYLSIRQSAGCLDLVVRAKGEETGGEEKTCLVDIKSRLNGSTFEEDEVQLEGYSEMWNEQNPDCPIDMIFIFQPVIFNSRSRTKYYTFENLTGKQNPRRWANLCENYNMNPKHFPFKPKKRIISGVYKRGSDVSNEAIFEEYDIILEKVLEMRRDSQTGEF